MSTTPVQNEATATDAEFEHFGRTWHVPAKQRLSHMLAFREGFSHYGNLDVAMCHAYLSADEFAALREIDPDEDQLDGFTDDMAKALGFKSAGNS